MIKKRTYRKKAPDVYEHLEHYVRHTTYADRLKWLQEANAFVNEVERRRRKGVLFVKGTRDVGRKKKEE